MRTVESARAHLYRCTRTTHTLYPYPRRQTCRPPLTCSQSVSPRVSMLGSFLREAAVTAANNPHRATVRRSRRRCGRSSRWFFFVRPFATAEQQFRSLRSCCFVRRILRSVRRSTPFVSRLFCLCSARRLVRLGENTKRHRTRVFKFRTCNDNVNLTANFGFFSLYTRRVFLTLTFPRRRAFVSRQSSA